jgi:hypothetical protein
MPARICLALWLALTATLGCAAEVGILTIVEGNARVLRGVSWHKLLPGVRLEEADIVEVGDRAQVQLETTTGLLNLAGPGMLYVVGTVSRDGKQAGPLELVLTRGWLKLANKPPGAGLRVRSSLAVLNVNDGIGVVHVESGLLEVFLEAGGARIAETGKDGKEASAHDVRPGEYWGRPADGPFSSERRPPPQFVAALPRHLKDPLFPLASRFKGKTVQLVVDRDISYAEAEPWLAGSSRRVFVQRFQRRLSDPAFRSGVEAHINAYPEWDRILHPQKYAPKEPAQ